MIIKVFVKGPIDANNYLVIDEKTNDAVLIDCSSAEDSCCQRRYDTSSFGTRYDADVCRHVAC